MINVVEQSRTCRQHRSPELLARVRDWIEREIRFVELPEFTRPDAATKIQSLRPVSLDDLSESVKAEPGLAFVQRDFSMGGCNECRGEPGYTASDDCDFHTHIITHPDEMFTRLDICSLMPHLV